VTEINLQNYKFKGIFRDYQQDVLDKVAEYLVNRKIHIVAAPGSGKTILGLELIRQLGAPALVLSPSVTIRQQWGERFAEGFMDEPDKLGDVFSFNLREPKLITSITYQALHAAYNKMMSDEEVETDDEDEVEHTEVVDYSAFDLVATIKAAGIKTICLDEAHHLKNEWQKALEGFVASMKDVDIISLTATPPYDSTLTEWNRYISLCGEIDAEIFIPELVKQKTLCPHQDYIYFSYPTKEERDILSGYKSNALECVEDIVLSQSFNDAVYNSGVIQNYKNADMMESILDNPDEFASILTLAARARVKVPKKLIKIISPQKELKKYTLETAQTAIGFILRNPETFGEKESMEIRAILSSYNFISGNVINLTGDRKIKKMLAGSMGKLSGINSIAIEECEDMGDGLRMVILTDFIRKDAMSLIGTDSVIKTMGTVPIFESVRRAVGDIAKIALLSGSLVIVPNETAESIEKIAERRNISYREKPLEKADYTELVFTGSNKNKVAVLTEALESGLINILVGTKALLGEGWDSPCINSLILASFVGSFMLSNQMRGRAIRIDRNKPDKTANIWHLATIEPPYLLEEKLDMIVEKVKYKVTPSRDFISDDYLMLVRRFQGFLAPSFSGGTIESGIDRIDIIRPPFNEVGFEVINAEMLRRAALREEMAASWDAVLGQFDRPLVSDACQIPKRIRPNKFLLVNITAVMAWTIAAFLLVEMLWVIPELMGSPLQWILTSAIVLIAVSFIWKALDRIIKFISPEQTVKTLATCLIKAMQELNLLESPEARVEIRKCESGFSHVIIRNANAHDNERFGKAIAEMLTAIDNPRYIMIKKHRLLPRMSYTHSYACPSIIGSNKERAEILAKNLKKHIGEFKLFFTRNPEGRTHLTKSKQKSYLNRNSIHITRMKRVN